ncbi:MAG: CBS domain-containing protein [Methanomicrobiaceae archaeon]|nr:CBS domain-containing protein [Methanomicrobiaceae archaeon]
MKIKDVMTRSPVVISVHAKVREAAALLREHHVGGLPVMDGEKVVGMVTESDILSLLNPGGISNDLWLPSPLEVIEVPIRELYNWERTREALSDIGDAEVSSIMSRDVISITAGADIEEGAAVMLREEIGRLPVIEDGKLVGIVTRSDLVRGLGLRHAGEGGERDQR